MSEATFGFADKMDSREFRVLIKHCFLLNKNTSETHAWLKKHYSDSAPSIATVKRWFHEFKCGRISTETAPRSGRPSDVTTPENIDAIHQIIMNDNKVKLSEIADILNISKERVGNILREHLQMHRTATEWVPNEPKKHS